MSEPNPLTSIIADTTAILARIDAETGSPESHFQGLYQAGIAVETALAWLHREQADRKVAALPTPAFAS